MNDVANRRCMMLWCLLVAAGCVLVVLIGTALYLHPGQGGLFNRGNQSVPANARE